MVNGRIRKRPISEINVVPYIDVMLVLLIIFMVTAPLMTQGVQVDLPQASSEAIESNEKEPLQLTVDANGNYYMNIGGDPEEAIDAETVVLRTSTTLRNQPGTPVYVRGDVDVDYGSVIQAMVLLQQAGASSVGLITAAPDNSK
ncbi:MAG: protein TolR [Gammaproteobacteria bacterium]|nr:protein TolR [Gammaproteobacteria bacterium]